jgi:hypothetical protein
MRGERSSGEASMREQAAERRPRVGQQVRDLRDNTLGIVVDEACQYAHPKAPPVYSYLVRWADGQVAAYSESAFGGGDGLEALE